MISRVGRGPATGIDRVELAYFKELLTRRTPIFFLSRIPRGYVILDRTGGEVILNKIKAITPWGSRDLLSRFSRRQTEVQHQCQSDLRRLSVGKCVSWQLRKLMSRFFPNGVDYFNVGHANLRAEVFGSIQALQNSKIIVLIHDFIPIDYPEYSRPEVVARFETDMRRVSGHADCVIYNSEWTKACAEKHFSDWNRIPKSVVAHLGIKNSFNSGKQLCENIDENPNFVVLGTIEPRKNHGLLLQIWQDYQNDPSIEDIPTLHIIGTRGWNNDSVFKILDDDPMMGHTVIEHNNLDDPAVRQLLQKSWGLLFPSAVEGFGLPLIEAAQLGVPIICGENAIYREILGDYPLYLNVDNSYAWRQGILERAGRKRESEAAGRARAQTVVIPDWKSHFDQIFRFV